MHSCYGQFGSLYTTLAGAILLSLMLSSNLATSLPQSCIGHVDEVLLIGLTHDHLVLISNEGGDICSYYLPQEALDKGSNKIHLRDGALLSNRWSKLSEKFKETICMRFTVRDVSESNIIIITTVTEAFYYNIDKDEMGNIFKDEFIFWTKQSCETQFSISSTEKMNYYYFLMKPTVILGRMLDVTLFSKMRLQGSLVPQVASQSIRTLQYTYFCTDDDDEFTICAHCESMKWPNLAKSGFRDADRGTFYFFSKELVHIVDTKDEMDYYIPVGDVNYCLGPLGQKVFETSKFFTYPPPTIPPPSSSSEPPSTMKPVPRTRSEDPEDSPDTTTKSSPTSNVGLIIGIVLIVIILFAGAALAFYFFGYKKKPVNGAKDTKTKIDRSKIKNNAHSTEKLGANSKEKQERKVRSLRKDNFASKQKASSHNNLNNKKATRR